MIVKITFRDNDFQPRLENILQRFPKVITNFIIYGKLIEPNPKTEEEEIEVAVRFHKGWHKLVDLRNSIDHKTKDVKQELDSVFKACVEQLIDESSESEKNKEYLKKQLNVEYLEVYKDKWENGESGYIFTEGLGGQVRGFWIQ